MKDISILSDEDLQFICSLKSIVPYFEKIFRSNKELQEFRLFPNRIKISAYELTYIITHHKDVPAISDCLCQYIDDTLNSVQIKIQQRTKSRGFDVAVCDAISNGYFAKNIGLYLKLVEASYESEYVEQLRYALKGNPDLDKKPHVYTDKTSTCATVNGIGEQNQSKESSTTSKQRLQEPTLSTNIVAPATKAPPNTEYLFSSLCRVGTVQGGGAVTLSRLADVVDGVIQAQRQNDAPNRDILFTKERSKPENFVGIWSWDVSFNPKSGLANYIVSAYEKSLQPTEIIEVLGVETVEGIRDILLQGIKIVPTGNRTLFAFSEAGYYKGLLCDAKELLVQDGCTQLKPEVVSLPLYKFSYNETVKLGELIFFSRIVLEAPDSFLRIKDPMEAVRSAVLLRSPIAKLKSWMTIREARDVRTFLQKMPTSDFYQEIADACACTLDEAISFTDVFIQRVADYLQGNDIESEILESAMKHSPDLLEKCRALNEEAWRKENAAALQEAQEKVEEAARKVQELQKQHKQLLLQMEQIENQREKLAAEIKEKQTLAAEIERQVADRIASARKDVSGFISEVTFLKPWVAGQTAVSPARQAAFQPGIELAVEPSEHLNPEDVVYAIKEELSQAGVGKEYSLEFASFLYAAYTTRTPLLLAGSNGCDIADALSASLYSRTASVLHCEGEYNLDVVEECIRDDGKIVTVVNPFGANWFSHISELTAMSGKFVIAAHPFAEDLVIEPRGLYNYVLPVLTEIFVNRIPARDFAGGYFGEKFQSYVSAEPQRKLAFAGKLSMPLLLLNRLKQLLADTKALSGNTDEDIDVLFGILPYAYITGNSKMVQENLQANYTLSKTALKLIPSFLGDLE